MKQWSEEHFNPDNPVFATAFSQSLLFLWDARQVANEPLLQMLE